MSGIGRRLVALLTVVAAIGAPAIILRIMCVGRSCATAAPSSPLPFCDLPVDVRNLLRAGFYEGRSPDVVGVTSSTSVVTRRGDDRLPWPNVDDGPETVEVPLTFDGPPFVTGTSRTDATVAQIAPTLEPLLGLRRPHPEVRSGRAIRGVVAQGASAAPLVVEIVWRGIGSRDLAAAPRSWPFLRSLSHNGATVAASVGSLPLDPAAVLTTIGSGAVPREHGITGATLRSTTGALVAAWSRGAPPAVVAELGDDLDRATHGTARIALVGSSRTDRGLIGGTWYPGPDDDEVVITPRADHAGARVGELLAAGWGRSAPSDLMGIVVRDSIRRMDETTRDIVQRVRDVVPDAAVVVTATGSERPGADTVSSRRLVKGVTSAVGAGDIVADVVPGGLFVDQTVAATSAISAQRIADAMRAVTVPDGTAPLLADAFPGFAITFGAYC